MDFYYEIAVLLAVGFALYTIKGEDFALFSLVVSA